MNPVSVLVKIIPIPHLSLKLDYLVEKLIEGNILCYTGMYILGDGYSMLYVADIQIAFDSPPRFGLVVGEGERGGRELRSITLDPAGWKNEG